LAIIFEAIVLNIFILSKIYLIFGVIPPKANAFFPIRATNGENES
jgi:hypothetical protein